MVGGERIVYCVRYSRLKALHGKRLIVRKKETCHPRERVPEWERNGKYVRKPPPPLSGKSQGYSTAQHDDCNRILCAEDDKLCHASILTSEYFLVAGRPVILVTKKLSA